MIDQDLYRRLHQAISTNQTLETSRIFSSCPELRRRELDAKGTTALMIAAASGSLQTLRMLACAESVAARDRAGNTALHYAARRSCHGGCRFLLEAGSDPLASNNKSQTCAELLISHKLQGAFCRMLELCPQALDYRKPGGAHLLSVAASLGKPKFIDILLRAGQDPDLADAKGRTALHHALDSHNEHAVFMLIERTDLARTGPDGRGYSDALAESSFAKRLCEKTYLTMASAIERGALLRHSESARQEVELPWRAGAPKRGL